MFIAIPTGMNYRTERYPVVTLSLIGINTLIWLVSLIFEIQTEGISQDWIMEHLWLTPANCTWYAPFTSMFVHAGILHLIGNMIFLFLFGSCVEDMIGRLRFIVFYLVSGLVAEFVFLAMSPPIDLAHIASWEIPLGGASGAISGCMGMYLLLRASAEIEFKYFMWMFAVYVRAGEFEVPAWLAIIFWFLKDLFWAVLGMVYQESGSGVAFGAHVGGFLGGLALVAVYKWKIRPRENPVAPPGLVLDPALVLGVVTAPLPPAIVAFQEMTSETPTIFLHDGTEQTGPFTLTQVQARLQRGEISRETQYWSEGMAEWQNVTELAASPVE